MKSLVCAFLVLAAVNFSAAEDDGQYRPERYGADDGKYRHDDTGKYQHQHDGRYYSSRFYDYYGRGKYNSLFPSYRSIQPVVIGGYSPYQELIAPAATLTPVVINTPFEYTPLASSVSAVKYQPVTTRPFARLPASVYSQYRYGDQNARILRQETDLTDNTYHYAYQTENGIAAEENGRVDAGTRASGFYEYIGDDGKKYRVDYTADENGFHPRGAHLV